MSLYLNLHQGGARRGNRPWRVRDNERLRARGLRHNGEVRQRDHAVLLHSELCGILIPAERAKPHPEKGLGGNRQNPNVTMSAISEIAKISFNSVAKAVSALKKATCTEKVRIKRGNGYGFFNFI